jgi:hypothetical protein
MPQDFYNRTPSQVLAALNHAARTFSSFDAADWRAMGEECAKRADELTCMDCGLDVGLIASQRRYEEKIAAPKAEHRLIGKRWSCGAKTSRTPGKGQQ